MTNSRMTDPEVLEQRFPVLIEEFAIRQGSGGAGEWTGGEGALRRVRFLAPMQANILSGRRVVSPFGLAGGGDAKPGRNRVIRRNGGVEDIPATASLDLAAGDTVEIATPGGGGYGISGSRR